MLRIKPQVSGLPALRDEEISYGEYRQPVASWENTSESERTFMSSVGGDKRKRITRCVPWRHMTVIDITTT